MMKKNILCMMIVFCLAFTLLLSSQPVEGALTDSASPYTYPAKYVGNPVKDAGDSTFDASKTKFGALPGNIAIDSRAVFYKGNYYVLDSGTITKIPQLATNGTKYQKLYSGIDHDYMLSNLQIANDYLFWEERNSSGANIVRIRRMKMDGSGVATIANQVDKFIVYNGKMYVRDSSLENGMSVGIVSYNLDGSGRNVVLNPPSDKKLALVPKGGASIKLLEYGGGYSPFGFLGDKLYYVLRPEDANLSPELWRMNLDGSGKEHVRTLPVKGFIGFRMVYQNYLYYTDNYNTYRIPFSGGKAEQVLPDVDRFNVFGNKMIFARINYVKNTGLKYPSSTIFVADLDGKNVRQLFTTDYYETTVNIISPDYLFAEAHGARGVLYAINPNDQIDLTMPTGKFDVETNVVIDPMLIAGKEAKVAHKGLVADGWYYLRAMYNYLSINAEGKAEFNDAEPYQKFKFTYQGGGTYRIETENGKVLNVESPNKIGNGNRLIAQNNTAFDWLLTSEKGDLFSLRPYVKESVVMNASGKKKTNGTHIIVWNSIGDAPENARWRLIPATTPAVSDTIKMVINGKEYITDPAPFLKDGRTLVPMRQVFEILGATVEWNNSEQSVTAKKDKMVVKLTINSKTAFVNGKPVTLDVPAQLVSGRTMVPLRFVSESFGGKVGWSEATRTVTIETAK